MKSALRILRWNLFALMSLLSIGSVLAPLVQADEAPDRKVAFKDVQPLIQKYCVRCHNPDNMMSGVRVDGLKDESADRDLPLLKGIQKQLADGAMPPEDEPQPSADERKQLAAWTSQTLAIIRSRPVPRNGSIRRLTVAQYRNTLRDLLGLEEDLTDALPPDGTSKDGFTNQAHVLTLSPLQIESYFDIAEKALDLSIVDEQTKPVIQNFRVDLGTAINPKPCPDNLVLGANSFLLPNPDVLVTELKPDKPFAYEPFAMRTSYDFIEGYVGNDTIRAWRKFDSIYHSVFACMRGTPGYPKGEAHQVVPEGLLLRPAIPSPEIFGQSNTYGPMANFKISLRELTDGGNFRVRIKAARYDDALLLDAGAPLHKLGEPAATADQPKSDVEIPQEGIYEIHIVCSPGKPSGLLSLSLGNCHVDGKLSEPAKPAEDSKAADQSTAFLVIRLPAGKLPVNAKYGDNSRLRRIEFHRLPEGTELARQFEVFERRTPSLGVYLGLRRDCGSTLTQVGQPQPVSSRELQEYIFEGAINDYPSPDVEKDNVNYLAGIREIGVRSEYTDGRGMPRLRIRSVEFEGPYYTMWPPQTHRQIFIESPNRSDPAAYARDVIRSFASRAFRRPVMPAELESLVAVWQSSFASSGDARRAIKNALQVVLTSPQFLLLIETSSTPAAEDLDPYELASKLSYFLWNAPPDQRLLDLAAANTLHASLDSEIERLIRDPKFCGFTSEFVSQWLSLEKFDVVSIDAKRYPKLTRDVKTQLRQEPIQYVQYLLQNNLPTRDLVSSDFIVANEVTASYYGLGNKSETGFRFVAIPHENTNLGGVLTQAGILAGLSDGRDSNPVKRGAWVARKIIAEPPDDPPPNVPQLADDGAGLSLRQKLERHRNQKGCVKCHMGIDPWGVPFESMDAAGLPKSAPVDASSTLPDGTAVKDLNQLKAYLANDRIDQVAFSFLKHAGCYATGRTLSYNEIAFLQERGLELKADGYRMQDLIRFVIKSDLFLKK